MLTKGRSIFEIFKLNFIQKFGSLCSNASDPNISKNLLISKFGTLHETKILNRK